ncbi:MAG: ASKHA domain-containing protein [candidate division WOR-3 bacterium]
MPIFGLALDLGTTILKGAAVNLENGRIKKKVNLPNPQNHLGSDVVTRISKALRGRYDRLRNLLFFGIREIKKCLGFKRPSFTTVVGNPVNLSFYLNKPLNGLARYPFRSELKEGVFLKNPPSYIFPCLGGFIGGDTVAGLIASGLNKSKKISLYVDLGTNGEVVLVTPEKIFAVSTAAGPAFEGTGVTCGSFALPGAIDRLSASGGYKRRIRYRTIGKKKPIGICASGLIDLLGIMLEIGYLREDGRLLKEITIGGIKISQNDIRKLQLAVAAIHTGIEILLQKVGLKPSEIKETILTGEFGSHLNQKSLMRIGLLPQKIGKIHQEKDLPLRGAIMALLDKKIFEEAEGIREKAKQIELALEPNFPKTFVSALRLRPWG